MRYLLGIVRNVHHRHEAKPITEALIRERLSARDPWRASRSFALIGLPTPRRSRVYCAVCAGSAVCAAQPTCAANRLDSGRARYAVLDPRGSWRVACNRSSNIEEGAP